MTTYFGTLAKRVGSPNMVMEAGAFNSALRIHLSVDILG
jgi:hypothetical protein